MAVILPTRPPRDAARWWNSTNAIAAPAILAAAIAFYMVNLREAHFPQIMQLVAGWTCLAILFVMSLFPQSRRAPWRFVFLLISLYLSMRYMWWRAFETLIYTGVADFLGMSILFLAEVYSLIVYFLQIFVNFWPLNRDRAPLPVDRARWPTVDIFIPTYSESEDIVRLTALAATQIDYPRDKLQIYVLDDGGTLARRNDPEKSDEAWKRRYQLKEMARQLGVEYLSRESNRSAKAGNINHALGYSSGELILFLDCDHVPTADILQETVGHFIEDEKLFLVQTPHFFCNAAPTERSIGGGTPVPDESEMFYRVIHPGLDFWNASYFCGSAAVMRRQHLEEVGGMSGTSITEVTRLGIKIAVADGATQVGISRQVFELGAARLEQLLDRGVGAVVDLGRNAFGVLLEPHFVSHVLSPVGCSGWWCPRRALARQQIQLIRFCPVRQMAQRCRPASAPSRESRG